MGLSDANYISMLSYDPVTVARWIWKRPTDEERRNAVAEAQRNL